MTAKHITVTGARTHNLRSVDVDIPRNALTVITGVSGSGKSSLAFDTIYAEGQRRYVESLSAYARQYLEQMQKPDVDSIEHLSPAIAIEQRSAAHNPRSTVGTVTEIYDYLRLLFANVGHVVCYQCGRRIARHSVEQIVDRALELPERTRFSVLAPVVRGERGGVWERLDDLRRDGYHRIAIDGEMFDLSAGLPAVDEDAIHDVDVYVDRLVAKDGMRQRLADSVELAVGLGDGLVVIATVDGERILMSEGFVCVHCDIVYPEVEPRMFSFNNPRGACPDCDGLGTTENDNAEGPVEVCPGCDGERLRIEARCVSVGDRSIAQLCSMPMDELAVFFTALELGASERAIADRLLDEIRRRVAFLIDVGIAYLSLGRTAATLSGGEAQRIRLATQIGSSLVGVVYILDEPSIGLHARDNDRLLRALHRLRDLGNTVIVVEHDIDTVRSADYVIELGPGAGAAGGRLVDAGTPDHIAGGESLTGMYLRGAKSIALPDARRSTDAFVTVHGARANNLQGVTARFPVGVLTCVTGVSGSGKSSLVLDTLLPALAAVASDAKPPPSLCDSIDGGEAIERVISIDQAPIGRTPRSNPATYTGVFAQIRGLFANLPESRARGYKAGRYSFNVKGGRCETCQGDGTRRIEMSFLPDVYVTCDACGGSRYNRETLDVRYKGVTIAGVLAMTVDEAIDFLRNIPRVVTRLETMRDVGLGYVTLGQSATTLSGGEAQRLKLSRQLAKRDPGHTLYVLDEPTAGLHLDDIRALLQVINLLVDLGNTAIVIEHNLELIKTADHIIDVGPDGGSGGGRIVAEGTPEVLAMTPDSHTGRYLRGILGP